MIGRSALVGIDEARSAPPIEPINAGKAIAKRSRPLKVIALRYKIVAALVPKTEVNLFVPRTSTVSNFGSPISRAGSCINPPPPAIESIKPAQKAAKIRKMRVVSVMS
jgi:hypothetical protein